MLLWAQAADVNYHTGLRYWVLHLGKLLIRSYLLDGLIWWPHAGQTIRNTAVSVTSGELDGARPHQLLGQGGQDKGALLIDGANVPLEDPWLRISHWQENRGAIGLSSSETSLGIRGKAPCARVWLKSWALQRPVPAARLLDLYEISEISFTLWIYCIDGFEDQETFNWSQMLQSVRNTLTWGVHHRWRSSRFRFFNYDRIRSWLARLNHCNFKGLALPHEDLFNMVQAHRFTITVSGQRAQSQTVTHSGHLVSPVTRKGGDFPRQGTKETFLIIQGSSKMAISCCISTHCSCQGTSWRIKTRRWQVCKGDLPQQPGSFISRWRVCKGDLPQQPGSSISL